MRIRTITLFTACLGLAVLAMQSTPGLAKSKTEKTLPEYVLTAKTVAVMIDSTVGINADDPMANEIARKDVEAALAKWGRFETIVHPEYADIVIVIHKGHRQSPDASDPRQPEVFNPNDNGIRMGAQHNVDGAQPVNSQRPQAQEIEVHSPEDSFVVYQGWKANPTNGPAAWSRDQVGGLQSHDVPLVDVFRKAVDAADKAAAAAKKP
jgi:hypothetical protein